MFLYVTDTNRQSWAINVNKVVKVVEDNNSTLIYFDNGDIMRVALSMLELVPLLNSRL
jgi:hypothetical protein